MTHLVAHLFLALAFVMLTGWALGRFFGWLGQPPVMGEILNGILLGPSFLGVVFPSVKSFFFPQELAPTLAVIAQLGVVLYMFLVGLELATDRLWRQAPRIATIAIAGTLTPFGLGIIGSLFLGTAYASPETSRLAFALFMGVSLSVTALPILARILSDFRIQKTPLGVTALGTAAIGDVFAWCLLAVAVGAARTQLSSAARVIGLTALLVASMTLLVRPCLIRLCRSMRTEGMSHGVWVALLAGLTLAAAGADLIGIHVVFGAFLFGAMIPSDSIPARDIPRQLSEIVSVLFLPAFFAFTGMRTQVGLVATLADWLVCLAIIGVAITGKVLGTWLAGRWVGLEQRTAIALGVLMNSRGLMELIVLNVGLDLGVITPQLFAMLVVMTLVTTFITPVIFKRLLGEELVETTIKMAPPRTRPRLIDAVFAERR